MLRDGPDLFVAHILRNAEREHGVLVDGRIGGVRELMDHGPNRVFFVAAHIVVGAYIARTAYDLANALL